MELTDLIAHAWGWTGIKPSEVVGQNDFGNLMVRDVDGKYWRLCPEDLDCRIVATTRSEFDTLSADQTFLHDWYMSALVEQARAVAGPLGPGRKYCLKIPGPLGGEYGGSNLASISLEELIDFSGYIAHQIEGLPDGEGQADDHRVTPNLPSSGCVNCRFAPRYERQSKLSAVGLPVTWQPPHRSRRAVFPHRALREYSLPQQS